MEIKKLKPAKYNPRKITKEQLKLLSESLSKFGDLSGIVFNRRSGHLVGGHQRIKVLPKDIIIKKKEIDRTENGTVAVGNFKYNGERFSYREVDWPLKKEKLANIAANKHGGTFDDNLLSDLTFDFNIKDFKIAGFTKKELNKIEDKNVGVLLEKFDDKKINSDIKNVEKKNEIISSHIVYKSNNLYGIPDIKKEMCVACPEDIQTYTNGFNENYKGNYLQIIRSPQKKDAYFRSVYSFYTWDNNFEDCWYNPEDFLFKIKEKKLLSVVSPNFSLFIGDPKAQMIWNVYRSRWVTRYWQENNLKIIPDVNWSDNNSFKFCFEGIPINLPCISVQCQNLGVNKLNRVRFLKGLQFALNKLSPKQLLCYGRQSNKKYVELLLKKEELCKKIKLIWCDTYIEQRRKIFHKKG